MSPVARAAILISMMGTLEDEGQCRAAIYVHSVVLRLLDSVVLGAQSSAAETQSLGDIARKMAERCQQKIPNSGVLADTVP